MLKSLLNYVIILTLLLNASNAFAQIDHVYPKDSLISWTESIISELQQKHPGFYRYTPKKIFDNTIDSTIATIDRPLTTLEYYKKIKPLFAKIGCLHTSISLNEELSKELDQHKTLLPLDIFVDNDNQVFIIHDYSNSNIPIGSRLLSINNVPIDQIVSLLYAAIPSDGYNITLKRQMLNYRFAFWYRTIVAENTSFKILYDINGQVKNEKLEAVMASTFPTARELEYSYEKPLEFKIANKKIAYLSVHTFSNSVIKRAGQKYNSFINSVFRQLEEENISQLVIDMRGNTGGTDSHAVTLMSHFFTAPFRYWDKIEVTKAIAEEVKGLMRIFYKKPLDVDGSYRWQNMWSSKEFDYYEPVKPASPFFKGDIYILMDGFCMSSCADFIALMAHNKMATTIGQETGGGYQGNTSGLMPTKQLPMGLQMTVPLLKYTNAVNNDVNVGYGTVPDHKIEYTWQEWVNKKDLENEFVMNLIWDSLAIDN